MSNKICSVAGCGEPHHARGLCRRHYSRKRNATPEGQAQRRAYDRKRNATREGRARQRVYDRKRSGTPKRRAYHRKRNATPEGRARQRVYDREYLATPRGKAIRRAAYTRRRAAKRKQACACCTNKETSAFLAWAVAPGVDNEHILPLKVAELLGMKNADCLQNRRLYWVADHKKKTASDRRLMRALEKQPNSLCRFDLALAHYRKHREPLAVLFIELQLGRYPAGKSYACDAFEFDRDPTG